ncbi:hypothetical protein GCM10010321_38020 [Streptomyces chartreusis]|nr:hypothetical protein GCM10010321_38020 [Streptomyces chartreusis]
MLHGGATARQIKGPPPGSRGAGPHLCSDGYAYRDRTAPQPRRCSVASVLARLRARLAGPRQPQVQCAAQKGPFSTIDVR